MSADPTLLTITINAMLDIIWPYLPATILTQLAYV